MVLDSECNVVYFSDLLPLYYPQEYAIIRNVLSQYPAITVRLLKGTKSIWARDYMPIQYRENRLLQFRYEPSYEESSNLTHPKAVQKANRYYAKSSFYNINLDGGNVVKGKHCAIISDRIFQENAAYGQHRDKLVGRLEEELETKVIIIPAYPEKVDMTGHADGIVRWVNEHTLIGNNLAKERPEFRKAMERVLEKHGLQYINMPFFQNYDSVISAVGTYVNYLEIANLILFPVFRKAEKYNEEALQVMGNTFPGRALIPVEIDAIGLDGGLMNCISWCLKE